MESFPPLSSHAARDPAKQPEEPSANSERAKYKLLSPAKLPISRSPCITIPPGLSPSSFLESPVLLSNMKVEPSPTTGSLFKPQMVYNSAGPISYPSTAEFSNAKALDEKKSSCFEFKPQSESNMIPGELNHQQNQQLVQVHGSVAALESNSNDYNRRVNSNTGFQGSQSDYKGTGPCDDGYNWRKYGQKLVKGSEFPRSYYKCTHPNCEVKKLFERCHDGKIKEITYKGTHDHPKPQPGRRYSGGTISSMQEEKSEKVSSLTSQDDKLSDVYGQMYQATEPNATTEQSLLGTSGDSVDGVASLSNRDEVDDDDDDDHPFSKRRKLEIGGIDITSVVKPIREPRVVVQTVSEVDILDDGYRWRKYGQKVVRGNPNPRSYYKCTNVGCPVRKHVERASHDPKAVITTYEGKHNHDVPSAKTSSNEPGGSMSLNVHSRMRSEEADAISLNLGVGMSLAAEKLNEPSQKLQPEILHGQLHATGTNYKAKHAASVSTYYGSIDSIINQHESRGNRNEVHAVDMTAFNHSYPYPQNVGRILTGP